METVGGGGELEMGKTPLSEFGGDRLKEMEKIHAMQENEVGHSLLGRYSGTISPGTFNEEYLNKQDTAALNTKQLLT